MTINLPTPENNSGPNDWADCYSNDAALREAIEEDRTELASLKAESPVTWYTPKVIATEQTRESTSFGKLSTADEIANVVLPENGLIVLAYQAAWKASAGKEVAQAAIFMGANQLKIAVTGVGAPQLQSVLNRSAAGVFHPLASGIQGLATPISPSESTAYTGSVTTGQAIGAFPAVSSLEAPGVCFIFAAAGTYNISVQFKATSGSVSVKERRLWVATVG